MGKSRRTRDYLPGTIGTAFEKDLAELIPRLAPSPKTEYLSKHIFSKYVGEHTKSADERYRAAVEKWQAAERTNERTNTRLLIESDVDLGYATVDELLDRAAKYVAQVLGPLDVERVLRNSNHSNGASTRVKKSEISAFVKYTGHAHVSSSAIKHWLTYANNTALSDQELKVQEHSVLFTVPKSSEIDRVACKEPEINMILQRAVGAFIGKRLKRVGIDLNDQTINRELARVAYASGLGTVDLSSASDRISTQVVFRLLPTEWFWLLDDLRVKSTEVDGALQELNMFSSMGNGFTFELESLVFFSLVRAICSFSGIKGKISVYGDDIIAPVEICPRLSRTFHFLGFLVNESKSFWSGPIRESCGGHYHLGYDVTPFYLREPVKRLTSLIRVLNQLLEWDALGLTADWHSGTHWYLETPEVIEFHRKWSAHVPKALYGGQDVESSTSLVTGDLPRKRFVVKTKSMNYPMKGALRWWQMEAERLVYREEHLICDPSREVGYKIEPNPRLGSEAPWSIYPPYGVNVPGVAMPTRSDGTRE